MNVLNAIARRAPVRTLPIVGLAVVALVASTAEAKPTQETWYEFLFHKKKVGFLHSKDEPTTLSGQKVSHAHRRSVVTVRRQDHVVRMESTTDAWSSLKGQPIRFEHVRVESGAKRKIEGFREGKEFVVRFTVDGNLTEKRHSLKGTVLLSASLDAFFKRDLKVGKRLAGKLIIEEDGELRDFDVRVVRKDKDLFVIESKVASGAGNDVVSTEWVNAAGTTVRSHVARLGAEFVSTTRQKALHLEKTEDIFQAARLESHVRLPSGDDLDVLVVEMVGRSGAAPRVIKDGRQTPKKLRKDALRLKIRVQSSPKRPAKIPVKTKKVQKYLQGTPYEAVDDERLRSKASEVAAGAKTTWDAAKAINAFVYGHIKNKSLAKAFSTANEALASREGDCTEHAVLFSALAKTLGIPTKLITGLVYVGGNEGIFGYHQWVEVWTGRGWIAMDPTFGQDIADPTHIKFTEGMSDADGLRDAGIAAAELFGDIQLNVVEYTTASGKRVRM